MRVTITSLFTIFLFAHSALAHGWLNDIKVDGHSYPGNTPPSKTTPSVIRPVSTWSPVLGATNPSLNCGMNATRAPDVATVKAGSELQFYWKTMMAPSYRWFHNTGPMLWYMADCGNTTCDKFDSTKAKWFKISQVGQVPGSTTWYQANLVNGSPANVTIPSNIAPGNYLIRHEIINLGRADGSTPDITEFFPSCSQLKITGSGNGKPKDSELVSFPGAYQDKEPSIFNNAYNYKAGSYKFPGPAIAAFVTDSSHSSSSGNGTSSTHSRTSSPSTTSSSSVQVPSASATKGSHSSKPLASSSHTSSSSAKPASTGKCNKIKSNSSTKANSKRSALPPRRHSRRSVHAASW